MIYVAPGAAFEATLSGAPTGLTGTLGVRILDNAGGTFLARTTAGIAEFPAGSGFYAVSLTAASTAGQFTVMWDTGSVSPSTTFTDDLIVTSSAAGVTPPSGSDLTTLAQVRQLMQKKVADTAQDTMIAALIGPASKAIMRRTDRQFAPIETGVIKTFEFPWEGELLSLAPYDLRACTLVQVDTDQTTPYTLSTDEWRLWPQPARDGTYLSLRLRPFGASLGRVMWRNRQVKVTGDWGFASVPAEVAHATALTVVHWISVNTAVGRVPDETPEGFTPPRRGIPNEAYELIMPYKRAVIA